MSLYIIKVIDEDSGATMASWPCPEREFDEVKIAIEKILFGRD